MQNILEEMRFDLVPASRFIYAIHSTMCGGRCTLAITLSPVCLPTVCCDLFPTCENATMAEKGSIGRKLAYISLRCVGLLCSAKETETGREMGGFFVPAGVALPACLVRRGQERCLQAVLGLGLMRAPVDAYVDSLQHDVTTALLLP